MLGYRKPMVAWVLSPFVAVVLLCILGKSAIRAEDVIFEDSVLPMLQRNCTACHNAKLAEGGLNLESMPALERGGDNGQTITTGKSETSLLVGRASGTTNTIMPPEGNSVGAVPLTAEQLQVVRLWIDQGAKSRMVSDPSQPVHNAVSTKPFPEHLRASYAIAVTPDGDYLAFGRGNKLIVHPSRTNPMLASLDPSTAPELPFQRAPIAIPAHTDFIHSLAISPNGDRIATGSTGVLKIWKRTSSATLQEGVVLREGALVATSTSGNRIAIVGRIDPNAPNGPSTLQSIAILDTGSNTMLATLGARDAELIEVAWSANGQFVYAIDRANRLMAWSLNFDSIPADRSLAILPTSETPLGAEGAFLSPLTEEGTIAVIVNRQLAIWKLAGSPSVWTSVPDHPLALAINLSGPIEQFALSSNRTVGASFVNGTEGTGGRVQLWDVLQAKSTGTIVQDRTASLAIAQLERASHRAQEIVDRWNSQVAELEKAAEGESVAIKNAQAAVEKSKTDLTTKESELTAANQAVVDHEKTIQEAKAAVEAATQRMAQLTTELEPKKKKVTEVEVQVAKMKSSVNGAMQALSSTEESHRVALQNVEAKKGMVAQEKDRMVAVQAAVESAKVARDGARFAATAIGFINDRHLATVTPSASIDLYAIDSMQRVQSLQIPQLILDIAAQRIRFDRNRNLPSQLLLTAVGNSPNTTPRSVRMNIEDRWELERTIDTRDMIVDRVTALAFSPDGNELAIGSGVASRSGQLVFLSVVDGAKKGSHPELHSDTVLGVSYSPDGRWVASCGSDKMTKLIERGTGAVAKVLEGHTHHVLALAWQDNGQRLATASSDGSVKIWDVERGESTKSIAGVGTEVTAIAFIGQTPNLVVTTMNNSVRSYDSNSGNQQRQFGSVADSMYAVAVSIDGKTLYACGHDGIARVWKIEDGALLQQLE